MQKFTQPLTAETYREALEQLRSRQASEERTPGEPTFMAVGPYDVRGFTSENMMEVAEAVLKLSRGEAVLLPAGVTVEHVGGGK